MLGVFTSGNMSSFLEKKKNGNNYRPSKKVRPQNGSSNAERTIRDRSDVVGRAANGKTINLQMASERVGRKPTYRPTIIGLYTHLVMAESMYTNFSPSVPSSIGCTEDRKLRRSLLFSVGTVTCKQRREAAAAATFKPSGTVRRHRSRMARTNIARENGNNRRTVNSIVVRFDGKKGLSARRHRT